LLPNITTGPDNTNKVLARAFGALIVLLLIGGSGSWRISTTT
jgi:cytochrome o ubiquinol oxidase operon protein cyoD